MSNSHLWKFTDEEWAAHLAQIPVPDLAWAAGFFDGEGCISVRHRKAPANRAAWFILQVTVTNTHMGALERLRHMFGFGTIHAREPKPNRRVCANWMVTAKAAERFLEAVLPHLMVKQKQAQLALEFRELGQRRPYTKVPADHHRRAGEIAAAIRECNGRGAREPRAVPTDYVALEV